MYRFHTRHITVLLVMAGGLMAGCLPQNYGVHRPHERVIVTRPAPPVNARLYQRAERDARLYTRDVARAVGLSPAQQRAVHERLTAHSHRLLERSHPRDHQHVYPFPRRAGERDRVARRFWQDIDRSVERTLRPPQRRAYRDYVRARYSDRGPHTGRRGRY